MEKDFGYIGGTQNEISYRGIGPFDWMWPESDDVVCDPT